MKNNFFSLNKQKSTRSIYLSGTNGLTANYGGWDNLLKNVASKLSIDYNIICHGSYSDANEYSSSIAKLKLFKIKANGIQSIFFDFRCLLDAYLGGGICLMMGTSGGIFFPIFKTLGLKIYLNPDGQEWKRAKWNKFAKLFLLVSDIIALKNSTYIIADHPEIENRARYITKKPIYCIPYGGDNAISKDMNSAKLADLPKGITPGNYFFKVCRIEPENNIELIIKAFLKTKQKIVIVGNWNNSLYGKKVREKYSSFSYIYLLDPIYESGRLALLRSNCKSYIHGHTVGGTNPSLVEAMNLGLDVICHENKFNKYTTDNKAIYFKNSEELVDIINLTLSCKRNSNGKEMSLIAKERYTWEKISNSYYEIIKRTIDL
tara:strand:- start:1055 stop:2179 length:1125 start_codon:yes stop_codon:yes gene_type:complete